MDKYGGSFHSYADDTPLYLSFNPNSSSAWGRLLACVDEVKAWMSANSLSLKGGRTPDAKSSAASRTTQGIAHRRAHSILINYLKCVVTVVSW